MRNPNQPIRLESIEQVMERITRRRSGFIRPCDAVISATCSTEHALHPLGQPRGRSMDRAAAAGGCEVRSGAPGHNHKETACSATTRQAA